MLFDSPDLASQHRAARCTVERIEISPCVLRQRDPSWRFAKGTIPRVHGWLVVLVATNGTRGLGHVLSTPLAAPDEARAREVAGRLVPVVQGADAFQLEALHAQLTQAAPHDPCVRAGFIGALFDLITRQLGVPLHVLFGGRLRDSLPVARLIPVKAPDAMADEAAALAAEGYRTLKLKLDGHGDEDLRRVRTVRARVGPAMQIAVDANQAYDADTAVDVCRALAAEDVLLVEQPVPATDRDGLKRVAERGGVLVEADEAIGGSLETLLELIAMRAAGSYNLKVHYFGGLRNTQAAMRICEAAGVRYRFGAIFAPRLAVAQAVHLAATAPTMWGGAELAEFEHLLDDPSTGLDASQGQVAVPDGPGSGVACSLQPPACEARARTPGDPR